MRSDSPPLTLVQKVEARQLRELGIEIEIVAEMMGKSVPTIHRALRELRRTMGPERMRKRSQYARLPMTRGHSQDADAQ